MLFKKIRIKMTSFGCNNLPAPCKLEVFQPGFLLPEVRF